MPALAGAHLFGLCVKCNRHQNIISPPALPCPSQVQKFGSIFLYQCRGRLPGARSGHARQDGWCSCYERRGPRCCPSKVQKNDPKKMHPTNDRRKQMALHELFQGAQNRIGKKAPRTTARASRKTERKTFNAEVKESNKPKPIMWMCVTCQNHKLVAVTLRALLLVYSICTAKLHRAIFLVHFFSDHFWKPSDSL